jgi:2-pyrone-4,6-dicarboxylate lactonase
MNGKPETFAPHRRDISTPAVDVPAAAWDTAAHVYGDPLAYPLAAGPKAFLPDLGSTMDELIRVHDVLGVERGVLVHATSYGADHSLLFDTLRQGEGRYVGVAVLSDGVSDETARQLSAAGVVGSRFNMPGWLNEPPTDQEFRDRVDRLKNLGWTAALHVDADVLVERAALFRSVDQINVCIDHLGHFSGTMPEDHPAWDVVGDLLAKENWWVRLSNADRGSADSSGYHDMIPTIRRFVELSSGRAVWGTDWPHVFYRKSEMVDDGTLLDLLAEAVDPDTFREILVDNPKRLYGVD